MKALPQKWTWLNAEGAPQILVAALKFYGLAEIVGKENSATIMGWAKELGLTWYLNDETPWCGLAMGKCASETAYPFKSHNLLAAIDWLNYGDVIANDAAMLADILVFSRVGGNHVGLYIAESKSHFLVFGGNQSNQFGFAFKEKSTLKGVRRTPFKKGQPANIRKIFISYDGTLLSKSEQ
jgi:uncharacterized protein (TIGR02594 family)